MSVNASDVKDILDTDLADADVTKYITQAGEMVTDDTVKTWLAAHLIRISRDREVDEEEVDDHSITYSGKTTGLGLDSTRYGQMAQMFDDDGELPSGGRTATVVVSDW